MRYPKLPAENTRGYQQSNSRPVARLPDILLLTGFPTPAELALLAVLVFEASCAERKKGGRTMVWTMWLGRWLGRCPKKLAKVSPSQGCFF